jgi:RNA polymerase primary sigma factor
MRNSTTANSQSSDECINVYFKEVSHYALLNAEEEIALSRRIQAGDAAALTTLVEANLRFVVKIAKQYLNSGFSFPDLIQEGNIGLMTAAKRFDWNHGVRFSTYACWWIKQAIARAVQNKKNLIRLPYRKEESLKKIMRVMVDQPVGSFQLAVDDIAESLSMQRADVIELLGFSLPVASLDQEYNAENTTLYDLCASESATPDQSYLRSNLIDQINHLLSQLEDLERQVISHRYALAGGERLTLKNLSEKLSISPETVRQIEIRALKKMRSANPDLRDYLTLVA